MTIDSIDFNNCDFKKDPFIHDGTPVDFKLNDNEFDEEDCPHPSADKIEGVWICGLCGCERDENMEPINENLRRSERN
jgi:hypothetical protein